LKYLVALLARHGITCKYQGTFFFPFGSDTLSDLQATSPPTPPLTVASVNRSSFKLFPLFFKCLPSPNSEPLFRKIPFAPHRYPFFSPIFLPSFGFPHSPNGRSPALEGLVGGFLRFFQILWSLWHPLKGPFHAYLFSNVRRFFFFFFFPASQYSLFVDLFHSSLYVSMVCSSSQRSHLSLSRTAPLVSFRRLKHKVMRITILQRQHFLKMGAFSLFAVSLCSVHKTAVFTLTGSNTLSSLLLLLQVLFEIILCPPIWLSVRPHLPMVRSRVSTPLL